MKLPDSDKIMAFLIFAPLVAFIWSTTIAIAYEIFTRTF